MASERQADGAIKFYENRAADYDNTWHGDFTGRFVSNVDIEPGQHVLDLACGTGLLTFLEADAVGPTGDVIGVDVTPSMLGVAQFKARNAGDKYANVTFLKGDVLHLEELEELKDIKFDVITVASALVLFPDPKAAIEHWSHFLKPGGTLALDATHPRNLIAGMVLEKVARRLGLDIPYNRSWSKSESTLKDVLESAGLECEKVVTVENQAGYGRRSYDMEQWDDFFVENVIMKDVARTFASNDIRRKAQGVYKEEWEKLAIDGKVEEVDSVFLGVARKPVDGLRYVPKTAGNGIIFKGGCRCGGIQYTSTACPKDIVVCHCRACQQLSGSAYISFTGVSKSALTFTEQSTREILKLSDIAERSFCSRCGAPISMALSFHEDEISLTMGSVDLESMSCELPKIGKHIFLREKAPWLVLGDDGAERWETFEDAHLIKSK
ncbi:S-adenosyl-L-methionine-dependent methyltransferase [Didymella exigua CBS 183.55]|uniref:S-adenosyl-L-methionine-dependent methyltransferase n=1 Tax=Didymella exigua CBS 183.55 TaxID=1150837 RepID=A0A6A5RZ66_9PLEO|nr:S-adenosyl-L-methionine-dependent methyltransferase [Didymella exigua CBS 183.55]KAF1933701.1 S-adenosyl-L-methionine-dependent methyltransferase [Didymella exigua CBS 183.55]